jgi:hypothetical protein
VSGRGLVDRFDDAINPIAVKELRQMVQSRLVVAGLMLFLIVQIGFLGLFLLTSEAQKGSDHENLSAGRQAFVFLQGILLGTCLLVPGYAGIRLAGEHSDTNVDLLFISTLKPRAIMAGKLQSAVILVLMVFSACAPFMTFTYLLRGLDMPTILMVLGLDLLLSVWAIQFCLFLAVLPAPRPVKGALGLAATFLLIGIFSGMQNLVARFLEFGFIIPTDSWEFWGPALVLVGTTAGQVGLMYVWSVAILNPATANRALPVRVYTLLLVALVGVGAWLWSDHAGHVDPFQAWVYFAGVLGTLQVLISINEREEWGPRVARTIPRSPLLRLPAFLLYSGAAGGVFLGLLMLAGVVAAGLLGREHLIDPFSRDPLGVAVRLVLLMGLYTYCFGLSGIFLRTVILRRGIKPAFTWVAALLLMGLGSVVPYLIAYFSDPDSLRYVGRPEGPWLLTNPFAGIDEAMQYYRGRDPFDSRVIAFLFLWAGAITLLCIPWFVGQMLRFRPVERPAPPAEVPLVLPEKERALPRPAAAAESPNGEPAVEPRPAAAPEGAFREADR